jgi:hypothetical protein
MKRMLAQKFIDWIKKAFQSILIQINGDDINVEIPGTLTADEFGAEKPTYYAEPTSEDTGELTIFSHGNSYSFVSGFLEVDNSTTTIQAGTTLFRIQDETLHNAILNDDNVGFDHILGKIKGGPWAWLTMTADGSDNVLFSLNVDLPADALIYFTNCVDVGDYNLV